MLMKTEFVGFQISETLQPCLHINDSVENAQNIVKKKNLLM